MNSTVASFELANDWMHQVSWLAPVEFPADVPTHIWELVVYQAIAGDSPVRGFAESNRAAYVARVHELFKAGLVAKRADMGPADSAAKQRFNLVGALKDFARSPTLAEKVNCMFV